MKRLNVYLGGERVGVLEEDAAGTMRFAYIPEWLARPDGRPLSRMLPLRPERFKGGRVRAFFGGILPEDEPSRKIAAILGISEKNDFGMLERIGGECAGAVCLLPEEASPPPFPADWRLRKLSADELSAIVAGLPRRPLMAGEKRLRLSLAGAQDKLPVVVDGNGISLPLDDSPSSHILKPEPDRFPGLVANELFCMRLAKEVGLHVPEVSSRMIGGTPCLIVERYDRKAGTGGPPERIHQEDFCQALGFPPERKYQQEGGPVLKVCIALLREWSATPVLDIRDFVDGVIFNVLIGNADAHAKNFSMLYQGKSRRLAPFYDLVCTRAWPELSKTLAMRIGKARSLNEVTPDHFGQMARESELGWPMVRERIGFLCGRIAGILEKSADLEWRRNEMAGRVAALVLDRVGKMRK